MSKKPKNLYANNFEDFYYDLLNNKTISNDTDREHDIFALSYINILEGYPLYLYPTWYIADNVPFNYELNETIKDNWRSYIREKLNGTLFFINKYGRNNFSKKSLYSEELQPVETNGFLYSGIVFSWRKLKEVIAKNPEYKKLIIEELTYNDKSFETFINELIEKNINNPDLLKSFLNKLLDILNCLIDKFTIIYDSYLDLLEIFIDELKKYKELIKEKINGIDPPENPLTHKIRR